MTPRATYSPLSAPRWMKVLRKPPGGKLRRIPLVRSGMPPAGQSDQLERGVGRKPVLPVAARLGRPRIVARHLAVVHLRQRAQRIVGLREGVPSVTRRRCLHVHVEGVAFARLPARAAAQLVFPIASLQEFRPLRQQRARTIPRFLLVFDTSAPRGLRLQSNVDVHVPGLEPAGQHDQRIDAAGGIELAGLRHECVRRARVARPQPHVGDHRLATDVGALSAARIVCRCAARPGPKCATAAQPAMSSSSAARH